MLLVIEQLLSRSEAAHFRQQLEQAQWQDGRSSAGSLGQQVKSNQQLAEDDPLAIRLGNAIVQRLGNHPLFMAAALPARIYPPRFNRYSGGGHYGAHVDSAIMPISGTSLLLRSDLSATLFLAEPDSYVGGELTIETRFGAQQVKLAAGDMVLYPSSSLHQVTPVSQGARISAFFWIQSMVADDGQRELLFDLDQSIQALRAAGHSEQQPQLLQLSGVYHNLLRRWASP